MLHRQGPWFTKVQAQPHAECEPQLSMTNSQQWEPPFRDKPAAAFHHCGARLHRGIALHSCARGATAAEFVCTSSTLHVHPVRIPAMARRRAELRTSSMSDNGYDPSGPSGYDTILERLRGAGHGVVVRRADRGAPSAAAASPWSCSGAGAAGLGDVDRPARDAQDDSFDVRRSDDSLEDLVHRNIQDVLQTVQQRGDDEGARLAWGACAVALSPQDGSLFSPSPLACPLPRRGVSRLRPGRRAAIVTADRVSPLCTATTKRPAPSRFRPPHPPASRHPSPHTHTLARTHV